jgi:hypothetical protein
MKHLMRYEGFSPEQRADEILDKIKKYGMDSISKEEKYFLDAHATDNQEDVHNELTKIENEVVFEDDDNHFKFELSGTKKIGDSRQLMGTFYVPDIEIGGGKVITGQLNGFITIHANGQISPDFSKEGYDIFDFCEGIEHELDSFVEYVVGEVDYDTSKNDNR